MVAVAAKNLHIRIFSSEGKQEVDADEKKLTAKTSESQNSGIVSRAYGRPRTYRRR